MNIRMIIADTDKDYAGRLADALGQYEEFSLSVVTSYGKLRELSGQKKYDIVLFDSDLSEEKMEFPDVKLAIQLYHDEAENKELYKEFKLIRKYQRISSIYKEILNFYAENAGYSVGFSNSVNTGIIAVYSPAGGSGKTASSLVLAQKLRKAGYETLFLSMEQLDSSALVCEHRGSGITELLASLAQTDEKGAAAFEMKLKALSKEGPEKIQYIEGFEKTVDYNVVTKEEIKELIEKIRCAGIYRYVVIDLSSSLDAVTEAVFCETDSLVLIERPDEVCSRKLDMFLQYLEAFDIRCKLYRLGNFARSSARYSERLKAEDIGYIADYGNAKLADWLHAAVKADEVKIEKITK